MNTGLRSRSRTFALRFLRVGIARTANVLLRHGTSLFLCATALAGGGGVEERVHQLRRTWEDEELPVDALAIDLDRSPRSVSRERAAEDVERLFRLLSQGWSGYALFDVGGSFDRARERILEALQSRPEWSAADLATLLREHLQFVRDCHTRIGDIQYGGHQDLWYDATLALRRVGGEYRIVLAGESLVVTSIGGEPPEDFVKPSLDERGEPVFLIGVLSSSKPPPLVLEARGDRGNRTVALDLRRSDLTHYSRDLFREDRIGGIPVIRIRTFSDHHSNHLERFLETADRHRGDPCLIVDVRGNGGGNERWASEWVQRLTGRRPGSVFITSELTSRTTMMGRANYMAFLHDLYPKTEFYAREAARYAKLARGVDAPVWSGPFRPANPRIPNETTVIVVTNAMVASAGEGFVVRAGQAENVVVVGENTRGALTFGNVSAHQLPGSGMKVWLPINFGLFPDGVFREEVGLEPDYWVPAAEALNRAVAAVRAGTIPTARPLPRAWVEQEFVPEDPENLRSEDARRRLVFVFVGSLAGILYAFLMRRKPRVGILLGAGGLAVGIAWVLVGSARGPRKQDVGFAFLALGAVLLVVGAVLWLRSERRSTVS